MDIGFRRLLLIAITATGLLSCSEEDPRHLLAQGKQSLDKGDYQTALVLLNNALSLDPHIAEARYLLGVAQNEAGDVRSAETQLRKALELGYEPAKVLGPLAWSLLKQGQFQEALDETKSAADSAEILSIRGQAQLGLGQPAVASDSFDKALELNPQSVPASLGRVQIAVVERKLDQASELVDGLLATMPKNPEAWLAAGDLQSLQAEYAKAAQSYGRALQIQPNNVVLFLRRASALTEAGKFDAAQADLDAARRIAPKAPSVGYTQALLFFRKGEPGRALEALQKEVLSAVPDHMPSMVLAGLSHYALNDFAQAERYVKQFLDRSPNTLFARKLLVRILLKEKQGKRAVETIQPALKAAGDDVQVLALAGEAYMQVGQVAQAADYLRQAATRAQTDATLRTKLGMATLALGETDRAIAELESAAKLDQNLTQADAILVMTYLGKKEYANALGAALKLEKKQPNSPLTYDLLGGAYLGKNDLVNARKSFERALSLQADYSPAALVLARLDLQDKDANGARRRFNAILKKDPNNVAAMIGLASVERATGNPNGYAEWLEKARVADSSALPSRVLLGRHYLKANNAAQALAIATEAWAIHPKHPDVLNLLGEAQIANNDKSGAVTTFARLISLVPQSPLAHFQLAKAYMAKEDNVAAAESLKKALKLKADYVDAAAVLASIELRAGRYSESVRLAQRIQHDAPKLPVGHALEGDIWMTQQKFDLARKAYERALALRQSPALAVKLYAATSQAGNIEEANALLAQWLTKHRMDAVSRMYLADVYVRTGQSQKAIQEYQVILQRDPKNVLAASNLATAYWKEKDPRALEYFELSYKLKPDSAPINHSLGWVLVEQGKLTRGLELLRKAAERAPYDSEIRYHLAVALAKSGDKTQARRELEALLANKNKFPRREEAQALLKQL